MRILLIFSITSLFLHAICMMYELQLISLFMRRPMLGAITFYSLQKYSNEKCLQIFTYENFHHNFTKERKKSLLHAISSIISILNTFFGTFQLSDLSSRKQVLILFDRKPRFFWRDVFYTPKKSIDSL